MNFKKMIEKVNTKENTLYDFMYDLVLLTSLEESEEDEKKGNVMTIEESKARLMQKYDYIHIK